MKIIKGTYNEWQQYCEKMRTTHRNFDQWNNQKNTQMKKINWQAVWIIIKNILIALLTANALEQRL